MISKVHAFVAEKDTTLRALSEFICSIWAEIRVAGTTKCPRKLIVWGILEEVLKKRKRVKDGCEKVIN